MIFKPMMKTIRSCWLTFTKRVHKTCLSESVQSPDKVHYCEICLGEIHTNIICYVLSRAHTVRFIFFNSSLGLYLSDCTNMMIMSHCGISVVINVRLYDSQDELKRVHARKLVRSFTLLTHTRPVTMNCIARGTEMLAIMKSIWTAAIPAYLRRIVYAALHTHMKTAAQPVFI